MRGWSQRGARAAVVSKLPMLFNGARARARQTHLLFGASRESLVAQAEDGAERSIFGPSLAALPHVLAFDVEAARVHECIWHEEAGVGSGG